MVSTERGGGASSGPCESAAPPSNPTLNTPFHSATKEDMHRQTLNPDSTTTVPQRASSRHSGASLGPPEVSLGPPRGSSVPSSNPSSGAPTSGPAGQDQTSLSGGAPQGPPGEEHDARGHLASPSPQQVSWHTPQESSIQLGPSFSAAPEAAAGAAAGAARRAVAESAAAATAAGEAAAAAAAAAAADAAAAKTAAAAVAALEAAEEGDAALNHVFIFTNPTSGGNKAAAFTRVGLLFAVSVAVSPWLFHCLCLSLSVSVSFSFCVYFSVCLSLSSSLCLFVCLFASV